MLFNFMFGNTMMFIDFLFVLTYCIDYNLMNSMVLLGVLFFGLLLLRSFIKYVDDSILYNVTVIDLSNEGGDTVLSEYCIFIFLNIIECLFIFFMFIIGVNIEMLSMTSVFILSCGSSGYYIVFIFSFDVEFIIGFEIEELLM